MGFWAATAALAALALVVRWFVAHGREWVGYDEANYLMIARNAREGLGFTQSALAPYAPKFHLLSFLAPRLLLEWFSDELFVSNLLFVVSGTIATVLIVVLGRLLFGAKVGLAAGALVAVASSVTSLLSSSISHNLYLPFFFGAMIALWLGLERGVFGWGLLAGSLVGLGWWARADGLLFAPIAIGFVAVAGAWLHDLRTGVKLGASVAASFALVYAGYSEVVSWITGGRSHAHGPLFDFLQYPLPCVPHRDPASYGSILSLFVGEPQCVVARVIENAGTIPDLLLAWSAFPVILLPLVGAGWMSEARPGRRTVAAHGLLLAGILPLAGYLPFYYHESRYVAPYAPLALVWCALGALGVGSTLQTVLSGERASARGGAGARRVLRWLPMCSAWLLLSGITFFHAQRMDEVASLEYREAGRWIAEHSDESTIVWTTQSQIGFHSHRPWSYPPELEEFDSDRLDGTLLAYDTRNFLDKRPDLEVLVEPADPQRLRLLFTTQREGPKVMVYRVVGAHAPELQPVEPSR